MATDPVTTYVTAPREDAATLARRLVDERLAACVNVVPCESVYRWDDEVHADEESILVAKTVDERYAALRERIVEWHPHDVPCIGRFDAGDAHDPFAAWCVSSVCGEEDEA